MMFDFMDFDGSAGEVGEFTASGPYIPEAVDCMRCGQCLTNCPTYRLTQDEQESPRQRIRTISRIVVENQDVEPEAIEHLNNCLQCRACEAVCPSQMSYGELFDQAQEKIVLKGEKSKLGFFAMELIKRKQWLDRLLPLINLYQLSGLRALFRKSGLLSRLKLERLDQLTPTPATTSLRSDYPVEPMTGTVALFTGCLADGFDRETLSAAIKVLNRIGYQVLVPEQQVCCGAIHYHNGEQESARQLMRENVDVFSSLNVDAVIYCATGCGSQFQDYQRILGKDDEQATLFQKKWCEISEFVEQHWPDSLQLKACNKKVKVHEPCSQRNVLRNQQAVYELLNKIPEAEVSELAENQLCCGAAGSYMLTHPENADALRDSKWKHIQESEAGYLVTSNIGCMLHLAVGEQSSERIDIRHPIRLIADLLE